MSKEEQERRIHEIMDAFESANLEIMIGTKEGVGICGTNAGMLTILMCEMERLKEKGLPDELLREAVEIVLMSEEEKKAKIEEEAMKMFKNLVGMSE